MTVTFDRILQNALLFAGNWSVNDGSVSYLIDGASASGTTLTLMLGEESPDPAPQGVTYAADPPDLMGENGLYVEAFSGFPLSPGS